MDLREYINQTGIPVARLADRLGISYHKLYYVMRGGSPSLKTILAIENYTNGSVRPIDWLTPVEKEQVYGKEKSKTDKRV